MKNDRTPRTMAECDFTVGYPCMPTTKPKTPAHDIALLIIMVATVIVWWLW